jgi:hypothetical protein
MHSIPIHIVPASAGADTENVQLIFCLVVVLPFATYLQILLLLFHHLHIILFELLCYVPIGFSLLMFPFLYYVVKQSWGQTQTCELKVHFSPFHLFLMFHLILSTFHYIQF